MGLTAVARALTARAVDLLMPPRCPGCGTPGAPGGGSGFCAACEGALPWLEPPGCARCGEPGGTEPVCARCRRRPPAFILARAACAYAGPVRAAIHAFKFDHARGVATPLAGLLLRGMDRWPGLGDRVDAIVPVPLHPSRRRERGYDQSALLAARFAGATGLPMAEGLVVRARGTRPQVGLDRTERLANLEGAFAPAAGAAAAGRTLLLVDDVMTTGATADACSRALLEAGAGEVRVYAVARD